MHLDPGAVIGARFLRSIEGDTVAIPDPGGMLVHLQFRRYAGCPICSLHLRSLARRYEEIERQLPAEEPVRGPDAAEGPGRELVRSPLVVDSAAQRSPQRAAQAQSL